MARNIVPRISGQETLGTQEKEFGKIYVKEIAGGSLAQIQALLAQYLPISGGVVTGNITFNPTNEYKAGGMNHYVNDGYLEILGAQAFSEGASIQLYGNHYAKQPHLRGVARIGCSNHSLFLCPDGRMMWENNDIGASGVVAKMLGESGYIKYASGLIMQWGLSGAPVNHLSEIVFPVAFSTLTYTVIAIAALGVEDYGERSIGLQGQSRTHNGCKLYVARVDSPSAHYFAIGN